MAAKSTNYLDTFIMIAEDSPVNEGVLPKATTPATIAAMEYAMITRSPYKYTSDDVLFEIYARRNKVSKNYLYVERERFFARGQACMRSSPLTKRFGWGIHSNNTGKIMVYSAGSDEYNKLRQDPAITQLTALRSKRSA